MIAGTPLLPLRGAGRPDRLVVSPPRRWRTRTCRDGASPSLKRRRTGRQSNSQSARGQGCGSPPPTSLSIWLWGFAIFFFLTPFLVFFFPLLFFHPPHLEGRFSVGSSPRPRRAERPPPAEGPGGKALLGFCVSATKGFYPGPHTAIFLSSPRPVPGGQGRGPAARRARPAGGGRQGPRPGCSPASAAPAATCGAFSFGALTLFSRRDAPAGPPLPGDGRLRPGLKSNFSSSGAGGGGGGGNRPLLGPLQPFSRPGGRTAAGAAGLGLAAARRAEQPALRRARRGGRAAVKPGGAPRAVRGTPAVVPAAPPGYAGGPRRSQRRPRGPSRGGESRRALPFGAQAAAGASSATPASV